MGVQTIGASVKRLEDPRLLRGEAAFVDDLRFPGMLHMAVLRSPHAHARLRSTRWPRTPSASWASRSPSSWRRAGTWPRTPSS